MVVAAHIAPETVWRAGSVLTRQGAYGAERSPDQTSQLDLRSTHAGEGTMKSWKGGGCDRKG